MKVYFKYFSLLVVFLFLAGCTVSKKQAVNSDAFPGAHEAQVTGEGELEEEDAGSDTVVEEEPTDEETEDAEEETCDPIEFLTLDIPEELAGEEEIESQIRTGGACGFVTCVLVDAPEWLSIDNCQLHGLANTAESLGEHTFTIHAQNMRNESEFVEQPFNLTVRDEPKINLFVVPANTPQDQLTNVYEEGRTDFDATLGWNTFYARVEGYAESYTVPPFEGDRLILTPVVEGKLYTITLAEGVMGPQETELSLSDIRIFAEDVHGNSVERTFNIRFFRDPCDQPLKIVPVAILKDDQLPGHLDPERTASQEIRADNSTDVILGTKYKIVFQAAGGLGPYEWSFNSSVDGGEECPFDANMRGGLDYVNALPPLCEEDVLTTNWHWAVIPPTDSRWDAVGPDLMEEGKENKTYFQLETTFSFDGKALPYNFSHSNSIYDRLQIQVTSSACREHLGKTYQGATYTLNHLFITPKEELNDIECSQEITDVWDTDSGSSLTLTLVSGEGRAAGEINYLIDRCIENEQFCEERRILDVIHDPTLPIDEIVAVDLLFYDHTNREYLCYDDCDHDQADYDLRMLTCKTPFRYFTFWDESNVLNDDVVPPEPSGVFVSAARTFGSDPGQSRAYRFLLERNTQHSPWKYRPKPIYPAPPPE